MPTKLPHMIPVGDLEARCGVDLGATEWIRITQSEVDEFGRLTGDEQWIHSDPARAADGPYGGTIAHGYFTLSLCSRFLEELLLVPDAAATINYGLDKVRFPAPVPVGARVRGVARIAAVEPLEGATQVKVALAVEAEGAGKPSCVAEMIVRYVADAG